MKLVYLLLAILFTGLALGGIQSAFRQPDAPSLIGDLVITGVLAILAAGCWKRTAAGRSHVEGSDDRPWQR